ncbi:hypothetical protein [Streptomyces sp. NPDC056291]|uniref:hypothetical protein n=1 Tax=Streptomyces sp. NPDC056291 TaxID=3345772 RepID=UPI0035D62D24
MWERAARAIAKCEQISGRDINADARELLRLSLALNDSQQLHYSDFTSLHEILSAYRPRSQ